MSGVFGFLPGFSIGPMEMLVVGVIAVLLFGSRLPEVGKSLGKSLMEFKKGLQGLGDELNVATGDRPWEHREAPKVEDREEIEVPKFEPPQSSPVDATSQAAPAPSASPSEHEQGDGYTNV